MGSPSKWHLGGHLPPQPQSGLKSGLVRQLPDRTHVWLNSQSDQPIPSSFDERKATVSKILAVCLTPLPAWQPDKDIDSLPPPSEALWQALASDLITTPKLAESSKLSATSLKFKKKVVCEVGHKNKDVTFSSVVKLAGYSKSMPQVDEEPVDPRAAEMAWFLHDAINAASKSLDYAAIWKDAYVRFSLPRLDEALTGYRLERGGIRGLPVTKSVRLRLGRHGHPLPGLAGREHEPVFCAYNNALWTSHPALTDYAHGTVGPLRVGQLSEPTYCHLHAIKHWSRKFVDVF